MLFERWNNLQHSMRKGGIFFALLPSGTTRTLRSPRFRLRSPKIGRKGDYVCFVS